jgi:hypothetical protein
MAYIKMTVYAGNTIEVIKYHDRAHDRKGGSRKEKKKPTSYRQQLSNEIRRERKLRWLLNENFEDGDLHINFGYIHRKGDPYRDPEDMKKDFQKFTRKLREEYRKQGREMKWVHVMEIGTRGSRHHHMVINYIDTRIIQKIWDQVYPDPEPGKKGSTVHCSPLNTNGDYAKLASYLLKTAGKEDCIMKQGYSRSRNLRLPKIKKEIVGASTFRKEPKAPEGWYIDKESVARSWDGDGYDWMTYRMVKIKGGKHDHKDSAVLPGGIHRCRHCRC